MRKIVVAGLIILILALSGCGQGSVANQARTEGAKTFSVVYNHENYVGYDTANLVFAIVEIQTKDVVSDGTMTSKQALGVYKVLQIAVSNKGNAAVTFNNSNFTLVDSEGREYSSSFDAALAMASNKYPGFALKTVNPGLTFAGWIAFDVPPNANIAAVKVRIEGKEVRIPFKVDRKQK